MQKNTELFLGNKTAVEFSDLLESIIKHLSENYSELINKGGENEKERLDSIIRQYLTDNRLSVKGMSLDDTVKLLHQECAENSFLTPYLNLKIEKVEGIEINSFDSNLAHFAGGIEQRDIGHFFSPKHAKMIMNRILRESGIVTDSSRPLARGHIGQNIRITVDTGGGTLDENVGIAASIRFINPGKLTMPDLIDSGTLAPQMASLLINGYRFGLSEALAGETDAGKTTLMAAIMKEAVPFNKKLITIENGVREFNLVLRDPKTNQVLNTVVHFVTRDSDDPKQVVNEQLLLEYAMTMNPDYLCMAEVKGSESFETIEAAHTHPVICTTHTKNAKTIPNRLVQLASIKSNSLSDKTLYSMVTDAFPILFYAQKMRDGKRRVTEISECMLKDGLPKVIPLWRYRTDYNEVVNGTAVIHGDFEQCGDISPDLQDRLRSRGIEESLLKSFLKRGAA